MAGNGIATFTTLIASGGTTSAEIALPRGAQLIGFDFPVMTSVAVTVTVATATGGTFRNLYNFATQVSFTVDATGRHIGLNADLMNTFDSVQFFKLVGGSSEGADRTITVFYRERVGG